jgi:hypothetical protein
MGASCSAEHQPAVPGVFEAALATNDVPALVCLLSRLAGSLTREPIVAARARLESEIRQVCGGISGSVRAAGVAVEGGPAALFVQTSGLNVAADLVDDHCRLTAGTLDSVVGLVCAVLARDKHPWKGKVAPQQWARFAYSLLRAVQTPQWTARALAAKTLAATGPVVVATFLNMTYVCDEARMVRGLCEWVAAAHVPTRNWCGLVRNLVAGRDASVNQGNVWVLERAGAYVRVFTVLRNLDDINGVPSNTLSVALKCFQVPDLGVRNDLYARWEETGFSAELHAFLNSCNHKLACRPDKGVALQLLRDALEESKTTNARVAAAKAAAEQAEAAAKAAAEHAKAEAKAAAEQAAAEAAKTAAEATTAKLVAEAAARVQSSADEAAMLAAVTAGIAAWAKARAAGGPDEQVKADGVVLPVAQVATPPAANQK